MGSPSEARDILLLDPSPPGQHKVSTDEPLGPCHREKKAVLTVYNSIQSKLTKEQGPAKMLKLLDGENIIYRIIP